MKVAVVHNRSTDGVINRFGQPCPEKYGEKTIRLVAESLADSGHEVLVCEGDKRMLEVLEAFLSNNPSDASSGIVFNMAYGIQGNSRYTHVPAMLEMAGVPYTGSAPLGHALALDKIITKDLIRIAGVPTPAYCVMRNTRDVIGAVRFPVIVKPRHESTSFGLRIADDETELRSAVGHIVEVYQQDALVEEYIEGREFCVGLLGNDPPQCLPTVEQDFTGRDLRVVTKDDKYNKSGTEPQKICPAPIDEALDRELKRIAAATFAACHCRDYARVDIRVDSEGRPFVLEINSMASLGPGGSYVCAAAAAGLSYPALVNEILSVACRRYFGRLRGEDSVAA